MNLSGLKPGRLLAMPASLDPNLSQAVLLVIQHGRQGSFGLVINRPSSVGAGELLASLGIPWHGNASAVAWWGGPVSPRSCRVLHGRTANPEDGETRMITAGVWMSTSPARLHVLANDPPHRGMRLVVGSIDWAAGQLAAAMSGGVYTVATAELLFDTAPDQLWERVHSSGIKLGEAGIRAGLRRMLGMSSTLPKAKLRRK